MLLETVNDTDPASAWSVSDGWSEWNASVPFVAV